MVFVADDFAAWLVGLLADAGRRRLTTLVLGSEQERALRQAATAAVWLTARELRPDDDEQATQVTMVVSQVFGEPAAGEPRAGRATLLEGLEEGIARQLAPLGDVDLTGTGRSSAELLRVSATVLARTLNRNLVQQILVRGAQGGPLAPLAPLAGQLNHDITHLQSQRIEGLLAELAEDVRGTLAQPAKDGYVGRLISEVADPFDLEVHRAITLSEPPRHDLPVLPMYVQRELDAELAQVVRRAADGESAMAVLVGGSSTGKTRACWEALAPLRALEGWRLWHPIDPTRPDALLAALDRVGPRTVLWLNEAQDYLDTPDNGLGEKVGAGVRELLRSPERGPVLVLASLWPEHWDILTTRTPADPHGQARELLMGRKIRVPEAFSGSALTELGAAAKQDERLAQAAAHAVDGQITQYLAGVPVLLDRYKEAPTAAGALIDVAIDARRLGHGPNLLLALLADAAPGYLTDNQWNSLDDDWLEQALAYVARPCNGIPGPLTRICARPHTHLASDSRGQGHLYGLADYLVQYGRRMRWSVIPPEAFWLAAAQHVDDNDALVTFARFAHRRWRIRYAAQLYERAVQRGSTMALRGLGQMNEDRNDLAEAEHYYREAAEAGDSNALLELGRLKEEAGDYDAAEQYYMQAVGAEKAKEALLKLGDLKSKTGDLIAAERYYQEAAKAGNNIGLQALSAMRIRSGDLAEGERLAAQASRGVQRFRQLTLSEIQERQGGKAEAEQAFRNMLAGRGKYTGVGMLVTLAQMREEAGDKAEAENFANQAASEGDPTGWTHLAIMRANRGDMEDAVRLAHTAADNGDTWALREFARSLAEEDSRWRHILRFGLEADGNVSSPWELGSNPNNPTGPA